jgi:holo-[acyl-carrier protein] synthase
MIIGVGIDIVNIERIERSWKRFGDRFLKKIFTVEEIKHADKYTNQQKKTAHFAKRFAAKEAFVKAIGQGFVGISLQDIEVANNHSNQPFINLTGGALHKINATYGVDKVQINLSLSDEGHLATAIVIISYLK